MSCIFTVPMNKQFFPALDIMRAILAIAVVYGHTAYNYPIDLTYLGSYSVMFFFSVSGFLLAYLANEEYQATNTFNVRSFYWRRILRIWPSYFLYIFMAVALMYVNRNALSNQDIQGLLSDLGLSAVFMGNLKGSIQPFFMEYTGGHHEYFGVLWSLSVEEQFYLFFPLFIVTVINSLPRLNITRLAVLFAACTLIRFAFLWYAKANSLPLLSGIAVQLTSYLDMIFFGLLLGVYRNKFAGRFGRPAVYLTFGVIAVWFAITAGFFSHASLYNTGLAIWYPVTGLVSGLAVLVFSFVKYNKPNALVRTLIYGGKLSYGIYLFHMPVSIAVQAFGLSSKYSAMFFPMVLVITIAFSHLVYAYFEKRFRRISATKYSVKANMRKPELKPAVAQETLSTAS